jgi:hypothetical protein
MVILKLLIGCLHSAACTISKLIPQYCEAVSSRTGQGQLSPHSAVNQCGAITHCSEISVENDSVGTVTHAKGQNEGKCEYSPLLKV